MIDSDRTVLRSTALAGELRDALGRRQKELPARWLAVHDASMHAAARAPDELEITLVRAAIERHLRGAGPRGVVCVHPGASPAVPPVLDAVCTWSSVVAVAAVELDLALARASARRLQRDGRSTDYSVAPLAADCTLNLSLPEGFPRPRLYLCLGNSLGATTAVGAVRTLRVLRSTMSPGDAIVFALTAAQPADIEVGDVPTADAERHLGALRRVNEAFGASFDLSRFECRSRYDAENRRRETHLVARRALDAAIPGVCDVRFRKGETIRTGISCIFERSRFSAMLGGVGLSLQAWEPDPSGRLAVAVASPAT